MKKDIALTAAMGPAILNHLRQFGALPSSGILAGQAVDSAITDLFGSGGGVYNDIDIFVRSHSELCHQVRKHKISPTLVRGRLDLGDVGGYKSLAEATRIAGNYGISLVTRKGMLNLVHCFKMSGLYLTKLTAREVLETFDLNCTRVAVDLETQELIWDTHYAEFLRSRQLRICMVHTPWHTYLRLLKKQSELPGVFVDLDEAAQVCAVVANAHRVENWTLRNHLSLDFGLKHAQQATLFHSAMGEHFHLEQRAYARRGAGHWKLLTQSEIERYANGAAAAGGEPLLWEHIRQGAHDAHAALSEYRGLRYATALPSFMDERLRLLWSMRSRSEVDPALQRQVDQIGVAAIFAAPRLVAQSRAPSKSKAYVKWQQFMERQAAAISTFEPSGQFPYVCGILQGQDYTRGQALDTVAERVNSFVRKHPGARRFLYERSLSEQQAVLERIQRVCKEFVKDKPLLTAVGQLGVLETSAEVPDFDEDAALLAVLARKYDEENGPFSIEPMPLPELPVGLGPFTVTELMDKYSLEAEGREMHHCVGGYASFVKTGRSRILRIRHAQDNKAFSTAELRISLKKKTGGACRVVQHFGPRNRAPDERNQKVLDFVASYLDEVLRSGTMEKEALAASAESTAGAVSAMRS